MKNSILFTIALFASVLGYSQDAAGWKIGIKLNPNVSWIKPDAKYMQNDGSNLRFGFALMIDKHFTDNYAFGTGLNIFRTGGQITYLRRTVESHPTQGSMEVISRLSRTYNLQYGEIPLTLKLRTNEIGYITYWGQFGVGLGFNIRSKADDEIDYLQSRHEGTFVDFTSDAYFDSQSLEDEEIKDDINLFRTSLIIGLGIEYNISGNTSIIAGLTYNNGFSDALNQKGVVTNDKDEPVFDSDNNPQQYELKGYTNFIELNVGVVF